MVWTEEQRYRHDRCGTFAWEWDANPDAWFADHDTCEGCRRLDDHKRNVLASPGSHDGLTFALYRSERGD